MDVGISAQWVAVDDDDDAEYAHEAEDAAEEEEDEEVDDDTDDEDTDDEDSGSGSNSEDDSDDDSVCLWRAAKSGNLIALEAILSRSNDPVALQVSLIKGRGEKVKMTAFMAAVRHGRTAAASFLLGHPSSHAALGGMMGTEGLSPMTALSHAAISRRVEMMVLLLDDPRVDAAALLTQPDRSGRTVMLWANLGAGVDDAECIGVMRFLLTHRASNPAAMLAVRDSDGESLLMCVAKYRPCAEILEFLMDWFPYMLEFDGYMTINLSAEKLWCTYDGVRDDAGGDDWVDDLGMLEDMQSRCAVLACLLRRYSSADSGTRPRMSVAELADIEVNVRPMLEFDWPNRDRDDFVRLLMELEVQFHAGPVVARIIREDMIERKRLRVELEELRRAPDLINEAVISMALENELRSRRVR